ncbi:MAG: hypothetical protein KGL39_45660, partial [Patescibacteria group bacterium]|nr:hypothetical protein [Patescibacteria group bacterium]
ELYYRRTSVPIPSFENLASEINSCKFDALYRLFRWQQRQKQSCLSLSMQPHHVLLAKLRQMARRIGIFHPVARVFNSPRCRKTVRYGHLADGPMEVSLLNIS